MISIRLTTLVLCLVACWALPARATSDRTEEMNVLKNITLAIETFESEHERSPISWDELNAAWGKPLDEVFRHVVPTRRYSLFSPPLTLRIDEKRTMEVVAITRKPMWESTPGRFLGFRTTQLKGPGRYVVYRDFGELFVRWFDESEVQQLWPSTEQALPVPDQEPERSGAKSARDRLNLRQFAIVALPLLAVVWIVRRFRGKRLNPSPA